MKKFLAVVAAAAALASAADASVVSGVVTQGGSFVELNSATPMTIGLDNFDTNNLYALNEQAGVTLASDLAVDGGVISAGTRVSSQYVFVDPLAYTRVVGSVTFSSKILGVISTTLPLGASDFLGAPAVTYLGILERGLERVDSYAVNGNTLSVNLWASTPGDYIRVITLSAVPLPAAGLLMVGALGGLAAIRRRRKAA